MQHNEYYPESYSGELSPDEERALAHRYDQFIYFLCTTALDDSEVSAAVVNYEKSAQNVRDRWELYTHADSYKDIEALALQALETPERGKLLDIGTADGKYLYDIASLYQRSDIELYGLELVKAQLDHSSYWCHASSDIFTSAQGETSAFAHLTVGSATDLSDFEDASIDSISAMFMMYHLDAEDRMTMLRECQRVLRPDGRLVITTSGLHNKRLHRRHEHEIARSMTILDDSPYRAPRVMNTDFISESAPQEMRNFKTVFGYDYNDHITLNTTDAYDAYEKSLRSMYDQFRPQPRYALFDNAVRAVMYDIERAAQQGKPYQETIQRQILVCSNSPISVRSLPDGFKRLHFGAKSELR